MTETKMSHESEEKKIRYRRTQSVTRAEEITTKTTKQRKLQPDKPWVHQREHESVQRCWTLTAAKPVSTEVSTLITFLQTHLSAPSFWLSPRADGHMNLNRSSSSGNWFQLQLVITATGINDRIWRFLSGERIELHVNFVQLGKVKTRQHVLLDRLSFEETELSY